MAKDKAHYPKDISGDWWRDIPGYEGLYQASRDGQIRKVWKSGKVSLMQPNRKTAGRSKEIHRDRLFIRLAKNGKRKEIAMLKIMVDTFTDGTPEGMVAYHKNGIVTDNHIQNIAFTTRQELGRKTGFRSKSRAVFKVNSKGEEIEIYKSAREAARANHMSYQTVLDRCNGKVKNEFALDGHTYRFEEKTAGRPKEGG